MDVPKGVTVMIDAGAVFKLRGANIDVGSSTQNINRSLGAIQVLGTPTNSVYFTSYLNERIGVDTYPNATTPSPGDWGGLVFENDYDYADQATDPTRQVLEQEGIFLDYVNNANISYGGGKVTVNGVQAVYDPIHMIEARPTVSFTTITHSADAALSADPDSLLESEFHDSFGESLYTLDYDRVGPDIYGNTLVQNSLNALFLRVQTSAGQSLQELDVTARYDNVGTVLAIPQTLVIQGDAGEAVDVTGTCPLTASGNNELVIPQPTAIAGTSQYTNPFADRQSFILSNGYTNVRFEFDLLNNGVTSGSVAINNLPAFSSTDPGDGYAAWMATYAQKIAAAINSASTTYGLGITATASGGTIVLSGNNVAIEGLSVQQARMAGGLTIDPGTVVKLYGTAIEAGFGARLTAEGTAANPIVFTSLEDDTYGAGGTFDTTNDGNRQAPAPGDWGGIYFGPTSQGSLDYTRVFYAGGNVAIAGEFATFAPVDIRQATVRIADSLFQYNTCSTTTDDRNGLGDIEQAAVIYVRFSQPVIVNNVIRDNQDTTAATDDSDDVAAISVDVNSLNSVNVPDWGRSTGFSDAYSQYDDNYGPLVRGNALTNNDLNGMVVRAGTLTTEGIWDDTDIAHIVFGAIDVPNFDTYGGLRLQSSTSASLVVKLSGADAGFTADGRPLEITDRVGGTLQVLGQPGHPVVLTDLADNTVSTGFDPNGNPMFDTGNNPNAVPAPGDWAGITLDEYSNDRNVAVINEDEPATGGTTDVNGTPNTAQPLGELAQNENSGDDTLRLGFEVHGAIALDRPQDTDVYSFQGYAGTEVWITLDQTTFSLNTVVELVDADGNVLARSDDWRNEDADPSLLTSYFSGNIALPMTSDAWGYNDVYSINPNDAAMRLVLPGTAGQQETYYVRVYSALDMGNIDAAYVPDKTKLDGETFQLSDATGTSATFEFINQGAATPTTPAIGDTAIYYNTTTSSSSAGIQRAIASTIDGYSELTNIDATHVPSLAALNGETFQITDEDGTTTYQFVDQKNGVKLAATGDAAVYYNSGTDTIASLRTDIVKAINDNHITIGGIDASNVPYLTNLNGETFQITYGNDQTATFEFVDKASGQTKAAAGDIGILFDSSKATTTLATIRTAMVAAINGAFTSSTPEPTAQAMADGTVVIHGTDFLFNAGTTPFTQTGRSYTAVVKPDGTIAVYGGHVAINLNTGPTTTTPFSQSQIAGTAVACSAAVLPNGDVALYGPNVVLNTGTTPFSQIGRTGGEYQMQIKLSADYEHPGSTVQYADISYATNGIQVLGLPQHSPLISDFYDSNGPLPNGSANPAATPNNTFQTAQPVGNLLQSDEGMINVSGYMNGYTDVSWYSFTVNYQNDIERIPGVTTNESMYPVIFDVDYADGMARPDTVLWIFDDTGTLILSGSVSNIIDDNSSALQGTGVDNLTQGSFGPNDPYIGPVYLPEGHTYYVAVTSNGATPAALATDPTTGLAASGQPTVRWEPVDSVQRVAEDNVGSQNASGIASPPQSVFFGGSDPTTLNLAATPFTLGDTVCYVSTGGDLQTVDAYTGAVETDVTAGAGLPDAAGVSYGDIAMRNDGKLFGTTNDGSDYWVGIDTGFAANADSASQIGVSTVTTDPLTAYELGGSPDTVVAAEYYRRRHRHERPGLHPGVHLQPLRAHGGQRSGDQRVPRNGAIRAEPSVPLLREDDQGGLVPVPGEGNGGKELLTNYIPWGQLVTPDKSNVTGLAFGSDGNLYCVTDSGGLYEVNNWQNLEFQAVPAVSGVSPPEIQATGPGPTLTLIANIPGASFSGLTVGPPDITQTDALGNVTYPYLNLLFAITSDGTLYGLDPSQSNPANVPQPIFSGGATSMATGIGGATGIAFSTLDYNLWHVTTQSATTPGSSNTASTDPGDAINATYDQSRTANTGYPLGGGESFWFGLENPQSAISTQPGATNYEVTNPSVYGTYNLPGGAYGSLSTQTFDLTNYTAADAPTLYFDYYLDAGGPTDFDSARVFASTDGANWTNLFANPASSNPIVEEGNLTDTNGQWYQESISLAALAGQSNVRLRFDFTTAGTMNVGDLTTTGAYLQALSGEQLHDGDTFQFLDPTTGNPVTYEFDMGMGLDLPNAAGDVLANEDLAGTPETFTVATQTGSTVFEFDANGSVAAGHVAIPVFAGETTAEVAAQIATIVNGLNLTSSGGATIVADPNESRVMLNGATSVTNALLNSAGKPSITLEGNGSGNAAAKGNILVQISSTDTAAQVAEAIVNVLDPTLPYSGSFIHVIGHTPVYQTDPTTGLLYVGTSNYTSNGLLLPYANSLTGDNPSNPTYGFNRFTQLWPRLGQRL